MRKIIILSFFMMLLTAFAFAHDLPACMQKAFQDRSIHAQNVHVIMHDGQKYYLVENGCCDMMNPLFDSQCHYICAPSGGFTGKGDMKCPAFVSEPKDIE